LIRILIAGEIMIIRTGLIAILSPQPDIEIVAEAECGELVVPIATRVRPDVAIIDAELERGPDGLTLASLLHAAVPECRTLLLVGTENPGLITAGPAAHAVGFLGKNAASGLLVRSVRHVMMGKFVIDPELVRAHGRSAGNPLTRREADALRLAAEGSSTAEIARQLHTTPGTVRNYLSRVIGKIGARNRIDAIRIATDSGWLFLSSPTAHAYRGDDPLTEDRLTPRDESRPGNSLGASAQIWSGDNRWLSALRARAGGGETRMSGHRVMARVPLAEEIPVHRRGGA
jgi:two-component system response regulator DesR